MKIEEVRKTMKKLKKTMVFLVWEVSAPQDQGFPEEIKDLHYDFENYQLFPLRF